ncbi:hypothetical protein PoB_006544400 [Plakobranchus ocellatus]|uniref:Uncharacterized protein n=1 Tax=Plakobranchus ocellatus TaxID=259542 RepID=A0AAV4D465_9GAST|nr:hypothetical protein PoB_006544400 [Plakobranchus ocellatus]
MISGFQALGQARVPVAVLEPRVKGPCRSQGRFAIHLACESALRSAGTLLSRVRAPLPAPWPDGGPESLRSPCCGLAIYKKLKLSIY